MQVFGGDELLIIVSAIVVLAALVIVILKARKKDRQQDAFSAPPDPRVPSKKPPPPPTPSPEPEAASLLRIEVESSQAGVLKESSQAFSSALGGKVLSLGQGLSFQGVRMVVISLEPISPARVGDATAVKIKVSEDPATATCQHCGQMVEPAAGVCTSCGSQAKVLAL